MPADPITPLPVRASDLERDAVARTLRDRAAEGRLSLDTFARRVERVHKARDREQLDDLVRDLPPRSRSVRFASALVSFTSGLLREVELAWRRPRVPRIELPADCDLLSIGRSTECDLRLADEFVSRQHAQLRRTAEGWVIEDRGSVNGTRVNGIRVLGPTPVRPGDVITLGREYVRFG